MCVTLVANTADWLDFPQLCSHWPILIILGFIVKHCFFLVQMSSLQEALLQFSVAYLFSGGGNALSQHAQCADKVMYTLCTERRCKMKRWVWHQCSRNDVGMNSWNLFLSQPQWSHWQQLRLHRGSLQNKSHISKISTNYTCDLQVFWLNGVKRIRRNSVCFCLFTFVAVLPYLGFEQFQWSWKRS